MILGRTLSPYTGDMQNLVDLAALTSLEDDEAADLNILLSPPEELAEVAPPCLDDKSLNPPVVPWFSFPSSAEKGS